MSAQALRALKVANAVRFGHAAIHREIAGLDYYASRQRCAEIFEHPSPHAQTMRVGRILRSVRHFGDWKTGRLLADAQVQPAVLSWPLDRLTDRQRLAIARVLRERAGELEGQPTSSGFHPGGRERAASLGTVNGDKKNAPAVLRTPRGRSGGRHASRDA